MVFNKLIFLASIAIFGLVTVNADQIEDWCPPCKRLIDDFAPELKTTQVQEIYDRTCNDVYPEEEDKEMNQFCKAYYDGLYTYIRDMLNGGKSSEEVCIELSACQNPNVQQRQKFVAFQKPQRFPNVIF